MPRKPAGTGRKRPLLNIPIERLHLDANNPRLPEEVQGKSEREVLGSLKEYFDLEPLAGSMSENGYFDEEPLVATPIGLPKQFKGKSYEVLNNDEKYLSFINNQKTEFIVVEGNRRLATVEFLLSSDLRSKFKIRAWPTISASIKKDLEILPVIIYPEREGILQYLGVRHIAGIKKWESFAKARYIDYMVKRGHQIDQMQAQVGDRSNSARKIYYCLRLVKEAQEEFEIDTKRVESLFSYLLLATGQGSVKEYLGIPRRWVDVDFGHPIPRKKLKNLKNFFSWIFGEGKDKPAVIRESRDITNYLAPILWHKRAIEHLILTRSLLEAYERTDAEEKLLEKYLKKANLNLEWSLSFLHRHKTEKIKRETRKCQETLNIIKKILKV